MSKVTLAAKAAFWAVVNLVGSTAFRHRLVVLAVPFAVEVVTAAQGAATGVYPDGEVRVAIDTAALFVANWLRGKASPA